MNTMQKKKRILIPLILASLFVILLLAAFHAAAVFAADETAVYASDLQSYVTEAKSGWEGHPPTYDADLSGGGIGIGTNGRSTPYKKGIVAHASSSLKFDVSTLRPVKFTAYAGIEDSQIGSQYESQASASFSLLADGAVLKKSPVLTLQSAPYLFAVDIPAGTKEVTLVTDSEGSNFADHTVWADAKFLLSEEGAGTLVDARAEISSLYIAEGKPARITVTGKSLGGKEIPASALTVSYRSSDPAVARVDGDGNVSAGGSEGSARITVTVKQGTVTKEATVLVLSIDEKSGNSVLLSSPEGKVQVLLTLDDGGVIRYAVSAGSRAVVTPSVVGFTGDSAALADGFTFSSKTEAKEIRETYKKYSGSYASGVDHCVEQSVSFTKGDFTYTVILRAYDDGFALRSVISSATRKAVTLRDEKTAYTLPDGVQLDAISLTDSEMRSRYCYESNYARYGIENTNGRNLMFPVLAEYGDRLYALFSEADLYSAGERSDTYYGSALRGVGNNTLELTPAPIASPSVTVNTPFRSPWRMGIVGGLADIVESDLVDALNPHTAEDFSWVEPGVTAWMWLSEGLQGQRNEATLRDYVDLAAEMNWKYLILDEGWQPNATVLGKVYDGYFDYFDELIDYADSKGVGFIVWVKYVDLDTAKEREILREWAKLGIKGIKADFFDDERPTVIADMQEIYRICAEEHLLVNLHGANKPTGERSLYPNVINREAVNGQEFGAVSTSNMTVWPYTRGVLGPSDITPTLYPTASTTVGHQLAINIVTESGMPCMASDSEVYREAAVKSYLRALPARWDDLRFLCGEPFRSAVLARRSGNEWWVGGLANGSADAAFSLDYLDEGKDYLAVLYEDGDGQNEVRITESTVRRGDSMSLSMKQNGGFVLRLIPKDDVKEVETITPSGALYTVNAGETLRISATVSPANAVHADLVYSVSDPSVASVSEGGVVTALHPGVTEIVIRNEKSGVRASAELRIVRPLGMQKSEDWILYNGNSSAPAKFFGDAPNRAELTVLTGDVWNDPQSLLRDAPEGDFTVTVKLTGGLTKDFQSAGLSAYAGYGRMVLMERRSHTGLGGNVFCLSTHDGKGYTEYRVPEKDPAADAYLKLEKKGNVFTGYYSYDGKTFTRLPQTINAAYVGGAEDLKVGIVTRSGAYQAQMQVTFESFTLNGEVKPFSVNVTEKELCKLYPAKLSVPVGYSPAGQTPALPATVRGYLSDGHFAEIPVEWNTAGLDFSRNGILNVTGKIKTGSPYAGSGLLPHLQILVGEVSPYDLDGDSILTVQDVTLLLRYLAAPQSVTLVRTGDINGDGKVSAKDISRLLHLL